MERCQDCGETYATVYRVPNHLWALIAGDLNLLCLLCADRRARDLDLELYFDASVGHWRDFREAEGKVAAQRAANAKLQQSYNAVKAEMLGQRRRAERAETMLRATADALALLDSWAHRLRLPRRWYANICDAHDLALGAPNTDENFPWTARCPRPMKIAYTSPEDAVAAAESVRARDRDRGILKGVRIYRCRCGHWHLTSRAPRDIVIAENALFRELLAEHGIPVPDLWDGSEVHGG